MKKPQGFQVGHQVNVGRIRSKEFRAKLRKIHLGKKMSTESCRKMSLAHTGKTLSEEHKKKISNALKGRKPSKLNLKILKEKTGEKNANWRGGIKRCVNGRIKLYIRPGVYRYRAVLIAEKVLGRLLKRNECVHHINQDISDDRNENLLICTRGYHRWLHYRMKEAGL